MITVNRKEFVLIAVILVVSASLFCAKFSGYNTKTFGFDPHALSCLPHNCFSPIHPEEEEKIKAVFENGYAYSETNAQNNTYHGVKNIAAIPTAPGWHMPYLPSKAQLQLFQGDEEDIYNLRFSCDTEISPGLPIVLLVTDPQDLFGEKKGIYVEGNERLLGSAETFYSKPWTAPANYYKRGKKENRNAFMVYYDAKGDYQYSSVIDIRITGNATRSFSQKSLRMDFPKKKHTNPAYYFFGNHQTYSSVVLRNGGNDWSKTLISDGVMQMSMQQTGLDMLSYKPCLVYINGVFWGIHSMRTRSDETYVAEKYQVKKKKVIFMENWKFQEGEEEYFKDLMKVVKKCKKPKDDDLADKLMALIDIEHFSLYLAAQFYFVNTDWPANNIKAYSIADENATGKWHFILFDLDYGMGYTGNDAVRKDMFKYLLKQDRPMGWIFKVLMKDERFKTQLKKTFETLLAGPLSTNALLQRIDAYSNQIKDYVPMHIMRWRKPVNIHQWEENVESLKDFCKKRNKVIEKHIQQYLSGT